MQRHNRMNFEWTRARRNVDGMTDDDDDDDDSNARALIQLILMNNLLCDHPRKLLRIVRVRDPGSNISEPMLLWMCVCVCVLFWTFCVYRGNCQERKNTAPETRLSHVCLCCVYARTTTVICTREMSIDSGVHGRVF